MNESDESLVTNAQAGSRPALEELVRRTSRLVYARLFLESGDSHLAEDLTQETYLQATRSLRTLDSAVRFRSWLLTIADNVLIDAARNRTRQKRTEPPRAPAEMLNAVPCAAATPEAAAQAEEERQQVLSMVRSLPEAYRLPLMLRYFAGADYDTIEIQLGLTNGALRGMLHRGLKMLREKMSSPLSPGTPGERGRG